MAFWELVNIIQGSTEPWDSPYYLISYAAALGLSAGFGYLFHESPWRWGVIVVFAQFPVMALDSPPGPDNGLWPIGLFILVVLALPAAFASGAGGTLRHS